MLSWGMCAYMSDERGGGCLVQMIPHFYILVISSVEGHNNLLSLTIFYHQEVVKKYAQIA